MYVEEQPVVSSDGGGEGCAQLDQDLDRCHANHLKLFGTGCYRVCQKYSSSNGFSICGFDKFKEYFFSTLKGQFMKNYQGSFDLVQGVH